MSSEKLLLVVGLRGRPRSCYCLAMAEIVFEVTQEADGGFVAECLTEGIFTQADTWEELRENAREAVAAFFFDRPELSPNTKV